MMSQYANCLLTMHVTMTEHVQYKIKLCYEYITLQTFNARLIIQAYLVIFDNGGGNLERDFSSARAFEMLSA